MKKLLLIVMVILVLTLMLPSCGKPISVTSDPSDSFESQLESESESNSVDSDNTGSSLGNSAGTTAGNSSSVPNSSTKNNMSGPTQQVKSGELTELARSLGMTTDMLNRSVVGQGNDTRIANAMRKAQNGEPVTIGFIGGSITQGTAASNDSKTYARQVADWWVKKFQKSTIKYVNAGVGATGSIMGVHRVADDLLSQKPDFVVVDFAVNDGKTALFKETYENLLRRILKEPQAPAVMLLFMVKQSGDNAQYSEQNIGEHYGLPMISYKDAVYPEITNNRFKWTDLSPDDIHPNDKGHAITAELINNYLQKVYDNLGSISATVEKLSDPIISDKYENGKTYSSKTMSATSLGSFQVTNNAFWQYKDGWTVKDGTQPLVFDITGKTIFLVVKKTNTGAGGKASIKVNGKEVMIVDSDFPNGWGDYAEPIQVCKDEQGTKQHVEVQLQPNGAKNEFTIVGILVS